MNLKKKSLSVKLFAAVIMVLFVGMRGLALAQSHSDGDHGRGGQHSTSDEHHDEGGCSGGCGGEDHETGEDDHDHSGRGPMYRGGGVIRGHGSGHDTGDVHDLFDRMESMEGSGATGGERETTVSGVAIDEGE